MLVWNAWRAASSAYDLVQMSQIDDDDKALAVALLKDATAVIYTYYDKEMKRYGKKA